MGQPDPRSRTSVRLGLVAVFIAANLFLVGDAGTKAQEYAPAIDPATVPPSSGLATPVVPIPG